MIMSVPPYVTYVQNLSDEDLVDIVKELMTAKIIGRPEGCSKFSDCVAAVRDFFKNVNGFTDKDMAYINGYAMAETTVRDEVFKRFIEIHDTQSKALCTNGDKIRSMTDEELDIFLRNVKNRARIIALSKRPELLKELVDLEWIKQPVK